MRVADEKKEKMFVEYMTSGDTVSNATASAKKAGYTKNPSQHGYWLKKKYDKEIRSINELKITSTSSLAINVLKDLLVNSEQDSVKLNTAKLLLELGNYSQQNINLSVDDVSSKTDEELVKELRTLMTKMPSIAPDLAEGIPAIPVEDEDEEVKVKH
jgi:phage terminase small subunit|tara:strand:+ start:669 stop:1139 length:471 start_codon:yes stop_codon:yes gene_type:complete